MQLGDPPAPPPPPPPPPPPLLPPPPPPPPAPGLPPPLHGISAKREHRLSRMRNFNWETIPKHSVIGKRNIWTEDRCDGEYELDTDHMEELFSRKQGQKQLKALNRQSLRGMPTTASGVEMVSILSSKHSMNIGIFLKQFKRPVTDMIEEIKSGSGQRFGPGKLKELCKMVPDEGEVRQLLSFKGDRSALADADLFMLMLVNIPSYEERLSSLVLKEEFFPLMDEMKNFIGTLTAAGKELLDSDHLHSVIRLVLKTGNYMNAGGYAGSAIGFRMASLLKLADTKANKPGMNLMHYVVMQAQNADVALLKFPEQLKHIEAAARINKCDIETEFARHVKKVKDAKADTLKQEDLKAQMEDFLKEAEVCLAEIERDLQELQSVSDAVADYFCEDPSKFKLEECCSIFKSFCERFMRAFQENKAREVAEVKRRHKDRLQIAAKHRSIATCSSKDKELDGIALESMLQNFLTNPVSRRRSVRPSSTHGSPMSGSPHNGSLSEITSETTLPSGNQNSGGSQRAKEMDRKECNSAVALTENSQKTVQNNSNDNKEKGGIPHGEQMKTLEKEQSSGFTPPANSIPSSSSRGRTFSATPEDTEEDVQDNSEAEAQTLREASKKVLRFQNSRSSVSSVDYPMENQKTPGASRALTRQCTFDEETQRYPGDPTNEDLVRFLLNPQSPSLRDLGRRHTLPSKVRKTQEEEDNVWAHPTRCIAGSPAARDTKTLQVESAGHDSNQVFDFTDLSQDFKNLGASEQNSLSAEKNSKLNGSASDKGLGEKKTEGKSTDNQLQRNSEHVPSKSTWIKGEASGIFFSFLKRLGDISKPQSSKETVHRGSSSGE